MMDLYYKSGCAASAVDEMDKCTMPTESMIEYANELEQAENALVEAEYASKAIIPYFIQKALSLTPRNNNAEEYNEKTFSHRTFLISIHDM